MCILQHLQTHYSLIGKKQVYKFKQPKKKKAVFALITSVSLIIPWGHVYAYKKKYLLSATMCDAGVILYMQTKMQHM